MFAILAPYKAFCQSPQDFAALLEFLPSEKISSLQASPNENAYAEMAYLNRHGYHLSPIGQKDVTMYPNVSTLVATYEDQPPITLEMITQKELNLLAYNFKIGKKYSYYRVDGTDEILVIPPIALTNKLRLED